MPKNRPTTGDTNWGVTLNDHLSQLMPNGGGLNFATTDPGGLGAGDDGYCYINTITQEIRRWSGSAWVTILSPLASNPPGVILQTAASVVPSGWLSCDGAAVSRTTYANLFALVGTTYGEGDGSTTFNVPDMRGRSIVGAGVVTNPVITVSVAATSGATSVSMISDKSIYLPKGTRITFASGPTGTYYISDAAGVTITSTSAAINIFPAIDANALIGEVITLVDGGGQAKAVGVNGGFETHTLGLNEIPPHYHTMDTNNTAGGGSVVVANATGSTGTTDSNNAGGGDAHNITQPYLVMNFIIKT